MLSLLSLQTVTFEGESPGGGISGRRTTTGSGGCGSRVITAPADATSFGVGKCKPSHAGNGSDKAEAETENKREKGKMEVQAGEAASKAAWAKCSVEDQASGPSHRALQLTSHRTGMEDDESAKRRKCEGTNMS